MPRRTLWAQASGSDGFLLFVEYVSVKLLSALGANSVADKSAGLVLDSAKQGNHLAAFGADADQPFSLAYFLHLPLPMPESRPSTRWKARDPAGSTDSSPVRVVSSKHPILSNKYFFIEIRSPSRLPHVAADAALVPDHGEPAPKLDHLASRTAGTFHRPVPGRRLRIATTARHTRLPHPDYRRRAAK